MNIHEHQAKQILKQFGAVVPEGVFGFTVEELLEKCKSLKTDKYVLKAQIHAGGRGKGGGVKVVSTKEEALNEANEMYGMNLVTPQTGASGKEVKRIYIENGSDIEKELYLSCLLDRSTSKVAFIVSKMGGMDIEAVAADTPENITTVQIEPSIGVTNNDIEMIQKAFEIGDDLNNQLSDLIKNMYLFFIEKDAKLFVMFLVKSFFSFTSSFGNIIKIVGNTIKVMIKAEVIPRVIMWPKSITGLIPLTTKEAKATIVVNDVYTHGINI